MKTGMLKSFADSRRVRYGTVNTIFTAIVIAIAIVLNSIITILSGKFNWTLDMTSEQLYTVSDELISKLENVSSDIDVDIIFCCDKDEAELNFTDLESGNALSYVHATATQLANEMENVSIVYCDPVRDYELMKKFTLSPSQPKPTESTVIIARRGEDGEYGTHYRVYRAESFYTFGQSEGTDRYIYGYNGERIFATAILSLTYDKIPTVYFTSGHGESLPYLNSDGSREVPQLIKLFVDAGFEFRAIDLKDTQFTCLTDGCEETYGSIDVDWTETYFFCSACEKEYRVDRIKCTEERQIPKTARLLIINKPCEADFDFETELTKIHKYMIEDKGSVMCFTSYDAELPVLYDFITQQCGVTVNYGDRVYEDGFNTSADKLGIRGTVASNKAAQTYLSSYSDYGSARPIFYNSATLTIDEKFMNSDTEGFNDGDALRQTQPLLVTSPNASFGGMNGRYNLMTVTSMLNIHDNSRTYSYMVVCPSEGFVDNTYLSSNAYPNEDIILALTHSMTAVQTPVNLDFKQFASYDLDITLAESRIVMICLISILPVALCVVGFVVIRRRKLR